MRILKVALALLLVAEAAACSGSSSPSRKSYAIHGPLTLTPTSGGAASVLPDLPSGQELALYLDPEDSAMILGGPGQGLRVAVKSLGGSTYSATGNFVVELSTALCRASITFSQFDLVITADGISGHGTGAASAYAADQGFSFDADWRFSGAEDKRGPELKVPLSTNVDPFEVGALRATEPLAMGTMARLVSGKGQTALSPLVTDANVITGFALPSGTALAYSTHYDIVVDPWQDLAGNSGQTLKGFDTMAGPALLSGEGFEENSTKLGGATIVDATALPPIAGERSAVVTAPYLGETVLGLAPSQLTVRLAVEPGDTVVRLSVQPFCDSQATFTRARLRVAAPGGQSTEAVLPARETLTKVLDLPRGSVWFGAVRTIEIPVPSGAAEVVVDFRAPEITATCGLPSKAASYLVDDVRVE